MLTVIIPVRAGGSPEITLRSLATSNFQEFDIVISHDQKSNANWARNRGFELAQSPFVLFSDDDVQWTPAGIGEMLYALKMHPEASYAYGAYEMGGRKFCNLPWDARRLQRQNFVSTMAVIRADHFPGFDESLQRLQDWDLWLTMLEAGHIGVWTEGLTFRTEVRDGITYNGGIDYSTAEHIVKAKHGLQ